jgi:predicted metal-dependent phosphoesterase TrpH
MKADLHIHSCYSNDGDRSVADILETCAGSSGLGLFSITDHNGIRGSREAAGLCSATENISFIPGIEIDCHYRGTDLHLLGYGVDVHSRDFGECWKRGWKDCTWMPLPTCSGSSKHWAWRSMSKH